jgi:hypothetical protein
MNHHSGMEMARQRQAQFQREANLRPRLRAPKTPNFNRTARFARLLGFRRTAGVAVETPGTQSEWRLSES